MAITASSQARGVGVTAENVSFGPTAEDLPRKILLMGNYDEATKTTVVEDIPRLITSAAEAADLYGFGFQLHRMAIQAFAGSDGVETWVVPVAESGTGVAATGTITVTVTTAEAGTIPLYIGGTRIEVTVSVGDDDDAIATSINAAVNADTNLPVTSGVALNVVTLTAKQASADSNDISITTGVALEIVGDEIPVGVTLAIVDMSSGSGTSDYQTALDNLGTGDAANEDWYTDCAQGNGQDSTTLDDVLAYVGAGNAAVGTYADTVSRPMKWYLGDTEAGSAGLTTLTTLGGNRKTDRAHLLMPVPGSPFPEVEIACCYAGVCAQVNAANSSIGYGNQILTNIIPGIKGDRWTADYTNRDTAVKAGIGTSDVKGGVAVISDSVSFYHPDSVPDTSNGYAEGANLCKLQNMLYNLRTWFESDRWSTFTLVADLAKVVNPTVRASCRDVNSMLQDLNALATVFQGAAWIYSAAFTVERLAQGGYVVIRPDGRGFTVVFPVQLSGVGKIVDLTMQFDTKIA